MVESERKKLRGGESQMICAMMVKWRLKHQPGSLKLQAESFASRRVAHFVFQPIASRCRTQHH